MSRKAFKALRAMQASWKKNEPRVRRELAKSGIEPDSAVVFAFAVYFDTLKKLAKE